MAYRVIEINKSKIRPHKAVVNPAFDAPTILVTDKFDYVELWLKRNASEEAQLYWQQAENFYHATRVLPKESQTIASYFCMLNATKSLLSEKKIDYSDLHGVSGESIGSKTSLMNEVSSVKGRGVFCSLSNYYGSNIFNVKVCLKDVIYNMPFVHRAYTCTYVRAKELFIPIRDPHFVKQVDGTEAWFTAEIVDAKYCTDKVIGRQRGWELDKSNSDRFYIRRNKRFRWDESNSYEMKKNIERLQSYHYKIRRDIKYIHGEQRLWYYKRNDRSKGILHWPTPSLIFVAMHRLSELTRYDPKRLRRHFASQHNWLLTEFISQATDNFIDQIARVC
ncbi:YaaC family protein [Hahella aquimaris]|uniref:YaaC family protein n=1 Tax=Hahella sp. HNIBRBA332 TaxID=3015983 RepID=UPI00273B7505|nr:YaaC family protein [Hahella sp. HNIBRBA332]WLQ17001.1 YaaC family protein [Hahella sp. HNIBRBA332]